jgi:cell division transport system permease protein
MMSRPQSVKKSPGRKPVKANTRAAGNTGHSWFGQLFQQHQSVAVDSLSRLLQEPGASFLTWSVIGIALALPLCLFLFLQNLQQLNTSLDDAGNISLFMDLAIDEQALEAARLEILALSEVEEVTVITSTQALIEFQEASGFGNALDGLDENPLPAVLIVNPATDDIKSLPAFSARLQTIAGVDLALVDLDWMRRLYGIIAMAERLTGGLALLLCLGVVLAIGNTVRLAIENRRDEIVVVKLVGGTDAYVSRPFLYTGIWFGVGGGVVAGILAITAFMTMSGPFSRLMALYNSDFSLSWLGVSDLLSLLLVAGGLGLAGAWLSVLRHLRQIEPS